MKEIYDLDTFIYRCAFAAEKKTYIIEWSDRLEYHDNKISANKAVKGYKENEYRIWCEHKIEPLSHAIANLRSALRNVHDKLGGRERIFFLSGKDNFRYRVATVRPYKGNRDPSDKPVHYDGIRQWAIDILGARLVDGMEADDACAIEAQKDKENSIIITNDKDLNQIPGWHFDWTKEGAVPIYVNSREAKLYLYKQCLAGDATDNVPGIEGIGLAGASKLLNGCNSPREAEARVLQEYKSKYGEEEGVKRFIETGRLVYILRDQNEANNLWEPQILKDES